MLGDGKMVAEAWKEERFRWKNWNKEKDSTGEVRPTPLGRMGEDSRI